MNVYTDSLVLESLGAMLEMLRNNKPNDRSERDRHYAVVITDLEKTASFFKVMVVDNGQQV